MLRLLLKPIVAAWDFLKLVTMTLVMVLVVIARRVIDRLPNGDDE